MHRNGLVDNDKMHLNYTNNSNNNKNCFAIEINLHDTEYLPLNSIANERETKCLNTHGWLINSNKFRLFVFSLSAEVAYNLYIILNKRWLLPNKFARVFDGNMYDNEIVEVFIGQKIDGSRVQHSDIVPH